MPFDAADQATVPREVEGVTYYELPAAPGVKLFRCQPYRADITVRTCAARFLKAESAFGDIKVTLEHCRTCSIGAAHAGRGRVHFSRWYGKEICPRCGRGTTRMIGRRLCVSCYNRQREMKAGRNARGHRPIELLQNPLRTVEFMVAVDDEVSRVVDRETCSLNETAMQVLRTTQGELAFARHPKSAVWAKADQPAPHHDAEPDDGPDDAPGYCWAITANRCLTCNGRILRSGESPDLYRCADCGAEDHGRPEEEPTAPAYSQPAPASSAAPQLGAIFRARLLATTALLPPLCLRTALQPVGWPEVAEAASLAA